MPDLRKRRKEKQKETVHVRSSQKRGRGGDGRAGEEEVVEKYPAGIDAIQVCLCVIGVVVCIYLGYSHAWFMNQIHENNMWFTNIKVTYS